MRLHAQGRPGAHVWRAVDCPENVWSGTKEAAAWLGVTDREFRTLLATYPDRLPYTTAIGKGFHWHWRTLVAFSWFLEAESGTGKLPDDA